MRRWKEEISGVQARPRSMESWRKSVGLVGDSRSWVGRMRTVLVLRAVTEMDIVKKRD